MINHNQTRQFKQSELPGCPVFIPCQLTDDLLLQLSIERPAKPLDFSLFKGFSQILDSYFLKFFAGDKNMQRGFADIPIIELYLWKHGRFASNIYVKKVCNNSQRFAKALDKLADLPAVSLSALIQINKQLRPTANNHGIRRTSIKAGNPKNNSNAFYCLPVKMIKDYLTDLINYNNTNNIGTDIDKALMVLMQFIFIHPFRDGNGRVGRLLFLHRMRQSHSDIYAYVFMLYLKNINRLDYHSAVNDYQHGDIKALRRFYLQAIDWSNQSLQLLVELLNDYITNHIGNIDQRTNNDYWQVVIRQHKDRRIALDEAVFRLFAIKSNHYIYINTPLLSCLNQFDYYLRAELRQNKQKYM